MNKLILFSVLLAVYGCIFAQSTHSDCSSAIIIEGDTYSVSELKGSGEILEISGNELGNEQYFTEEHNSVWFLFIAPYEGELTFTIIPNNPGEDWDFMLFMCGMDQCDAIANKEVRPIRSNIARNDESNFGITGLDITSHNNFASAGINSNMSKLVEVKGGETFLLAIDNIKADNKGFKLKLHFKKFEKEIHIEKEHIDDEGFAFVDMTDEEGASNVVEINFTVLEKNSNRPINCHAEIIGVQWLDSTLKFDDLSYFSADIPLDKWFFVNVKKDGYTFGTAKFKATEKTAGSTQILYISKVEKGNHIVLSEIVFSPNTTHMLPSSINALTQLIEFMNDYPTAKIEIQGHVNAPGYDNDGKVKRFSLKRAEQIKEYLVDAGINGKRMGVVGMGNEFMIYPSPSNYFEEKINRRVEIEIISY